MNKKILISISFFLCIYCLGIIHHVEAASCPNNSSYAIIYYGHNTHYTVYSPYYYHQAFTLSGPVGIKISPSGIVNAGNNKLRRTIDLFYTTKDCDCLAETAESEVTVTVTGTCSNGILNMQLHEVYPDSSAPCTCTCPDGGGTYTQIYPGTSSNYNLKMDYSDGTTVTGPPICPNCSGTYSWRLQFTNKPPPSDFINIVPLIHPLLLSRVQGD